MNDKSLPSPELLNKLLRYDAEAGKLFWQKRSQDTMTSQDYCDRWNARWANKEAFSTIIDGYKVGKIFGRPFRAHRVIWALVNGSWPKNDIDHINGNRTDNRILNLRDVSKVENARNCAIRKNNTSGATGVSWSKNDKRWRAGICIDGKEFFIGNFLEKADAISARKKAERDAGFHPNHGRPR